MRSGSLIAQKIQKLTKISYFCWFYSKFHANHEKNCTGAARHVRDMSELCTQLPAGRHRHSIFYIYKSLTYIYGSVVYSWWDVNLLPFRWKHKTKFSSSNQSTAKINLLCFLSVKVKDLFTKDFHQRLWKQLLWISHHCILNFCKMKKNVRRMHIEVI